MSNNTTNKPVKRNLYVFQDHYKSSNDIFRNETGKYFDFDGQVLSEKSIVPKRLGLNSKLMPGIVSDLDTVDVLPVDPNPLVPPEYKQTFLFIPEQTLQIKTLLDSEYQSGQSLKDILLLFLNGKSYADRTQITQRAQERTAQQQEEALREEAAQELLDALDSRNRQPAESAQELEQRREDMSAATQDPNFVGSVFEYYPDFGEIEDINFDTIRPVDYYQNKNALEYAKIESAYNFYIEKYEELMKVLGNSLPEEVLPNFYAFSLINDKSFLQSINQSDYDSSNLAGELSPYEEVYKKFDKIISLDGNISLAAGNDGGISTLALFDILRYYQEYASKYDNVSVDYVNTVKDKLGTFVNDISDTNIFQKLLEYRYKFPMYVNIEFYSTVKSEFADFIKDAGISLSSLQDFLDNKVLVDSGRNSEVASEIRMAQVLNDIGENISTKKELIDDLLVIEFDRWFNKFLNDSQSSTDNNQPVSNQTVLPNASQFARQQVTATATGGILTSSPVTFINYQADPVETSQSISQTDFIQALAGQLKYNELIVENFRSYYDIVNGKYAKSEILLFKIVKRDSSNNILQTFFVMNVPNLEVENFIDTQVKYGKDYFYEIYAWNLVYGTKYRYENGRLHQTQRDVPTDSDIPEGLTQIIAPLAPEDKPIETPADEVADNYNGPVGVIDPSIFANIGNVTNYYDNGFFSFDVVYSPKIKIVETLYFENRRAKILDKPPTAPSVSLYEYINNPTFSVALQTSAGKYSEFPVYILDSDRDYFTLQLDIQESTDGRITFKDEGGVKEIQVFKTDEQPYFYSQFSLYKTLKYPEQSAFNEINEFDKTFYYCFRCVDVHGNISNPTPVYTVKTVEDNGFFYQEFGTYEFPPINSYKDFIEFKKYLKISPSLLQKIYNYSENRLGILESSVFDKKFLVKLTSKHSGKTAKVFFKFKNKRNE
jgi:hypothetical protein